MGNLVRLFIPTWRFFNEAGLSPRLWRWEENVWRELWSKPPTPWYALLFNPRANLHHARTNLLERLIEEAQSTPNIRELVSYQIVAKAIGARSKFKVTARGEDVLIGDTP